MAALVAGLRRGAKQLRRAAGDRAPALEALFDSILNRDLRRFARESGAAYACLRAQRDLAAAMRLQRRRLQAHGQRATTLLPLLELLDRRGAGDFMRRRYERLFARAETLVRELREAQRRGQGADVSEAAVREALHGGCAYAFASPILAPDGFRMITGLDAAAVRGCVVADIGTGSGELPRFLRSMGVPSANITGVDVVATSAEGMPRGAAFHHGRMQDAPIPDRSVDLLFLSYFIDFDTDQRGTFESAVAKVRSGGLLVLDALLPCEMKIPGELMQSPPVAAGVSAAADARAITECIMACARGQGGDAVLERVSVGVRFVHGGRPGITELHTHFLAFRIAAAAARPAPTARQPGLSGTVVPAAVPA